MPSVSAWFNARRSIARSAAWRTRLSCQGDFGSHCSVKSSQNTPLVTGPTTLKPGVRLISSATGPLT